MKAYIPVILYFALIVAAVLAIIFFVNYRKEKEKRKKCEADIRKARVKAVRLLNRAYRLYGKTALEHLKMYLSLEGCVLSSDSLMEIKYRFFGSDKDFNFSLFDLQRIHVDDEKLEKFSVLFKGLLDGIYPYLREERKSMGEAKNTPIWRLLLFYAREFAKLEKSFLALDGRSIDSVVLLSRSEKKLFADINRRAVSEKKYLEKEGLGYVAKHLRMFGIKKQNLFMT